MALDYRPLNQAEELAACEAIERLVWNLRDLELVPRSQLVASVHAGGLVLGAFDGEAMVGFAYGFPAYRPDWKEPWGHHSHMLAVLPAYRGRGIGQRLKWLQCEWCLARGLPWMTWTFDPLQARNAKLNLEHLGARALEYRVNEYGTLGGGLNADLPTDRLVAFWELAGPRAERLARGEALEPVTDLAEIPVLLERDPAGRPRLEPLDETHARVRLELPNHLTNLLQNDPELALEWRLALRQALTYCLERGMSITRFAAGGYLLEAGVRN